jgi:hypothetical protein
MPMGASFPNGAPTLTDVVLVFAIAAIAAVVGVWLGIVLIAPRIGRALDRADANDNDEDPGDRPD